MSTKRILMAKKKTNAWLVSVPAMNIRSTHMEVSVRSVVICTRKVVGVIAVVDNSVRDLILYLVI